MERPSKVDDSFDRLQDADALNETIEGGGYETELSNSNFQKVEQTISLGKIDNVIGNGSVSKTAIFCEANVVEVPQFDTIEEGDSDISENTPSMATQSKRTKETIRSALFEGEEPFSLSKAQQADEELTKKWQILQDHVVATILKLENEIEPKFEAEKIKYESNVEKLKKLSSKTSQDHDKQDFYNRKLESIIEIFGLLRQDLDDLVIEIRRNRNNESLTDIEIMGFRKRLDIALVRLDNRFPIYRKKKQILKCLSSETNRVTAIIGKPGCGKSSQLPSMLIEANLVNSRNKKMYMTTPRQLAARNNLEFVRNQLGETPEETSCNLIRSTDFKIDRGKKINFSTDTEFYKRLVIREEIKAEDIGYLVIDEASSRKMYTDVMLSVARKLMKQYPTMKLVLMSTDLDEAVFNDFFRGVAKIDKSNRIEVTEENFITDVIYNDVSGTTEQKVKEALYLIEDSIYKNAKRHKKKNNKAVIKDANIIIFLSCAKECNKIENQFHWLDDKPGLLSDQIKSLGLQTKYKIFIASGSNSSSLDQELFTEGDCTDEIRLVLSTKVLETSLTLSNVGYVVDLGEENLYIFDFQLNLEKTLMKSISQSTAEQRRGRVGRTSRGVCIRMYSQDDYNIMDKTSDPELQYRNIDELVLSWVRVILQIVKDKKESRYFDTNNSTFYSQNDTDYKMVWANYITSLELITQLNPEAVSKSVELMAMLQLIQEKTAIEGESKQYKLILDLGVEPRLGRTLVEAIKMSMGSRNEAPRPWIITEVIDIVAANSRARAAAQMGTTTSIEGKRHIQALRNEAANYGDYYYNYKFLKWYKEASPELNSIKTDKATMRSWSDAQFQLRSRCKHLMNVQDAYFKEHTAVLHKVTKQEMYNAFTECFFAGFFTELSKFINADLGYYHNRIKKIVSCGIGSVCREEAENLKNGLPKNKYLLMADVIQSDFNIESRFNVTVSEEILKLKRPALFQYFEAIQINDVPSKIYRRDDLSSETMHYVIQRSYLFEQILEDAGQVLKNPKSKFTELVISLKPNVFDKMKNEMDTLVNFMKDSVSLTHFELNLKNCRINVGNGLQITEIMCNLDSVAFYFFLVPRYIKNNYVLLEDKETGPWQLLVKDFKRCFNLEDKVFRVEPTFTKVNYEKDSSFMNLKITCSTSDDKREIYERISEKRSYWRYDKCPSTVGHSELKMYDRMIGRDPHSTLKMFGIIFSLARNRGVVSIKCPTSLVDQDKIKTKLEELSQDPKSSENIFGRDFTWTSTSGKGTSKSFVLSNVDNCLDELRIRELFQAQDPHIMLEVKMDKDSSAVEPTKDEIRSKVDRLIRLIIKEKLKGDPDHNQYTLHVGDRPYKVRDFQKLKEAEVKTSSGELLKAIVDTLHMKRDPIFNLYAGYTHVHLYDKPEFHIKKKAFTEIETLIKHLNENIEDSLFDQYNNDETKVKANKSFIKIYPENLSNVKEGDNIKLEIVKGQDKAIANRLESIMRAYIAGKEISITEDHYSYFFGSEGKDFLNSLKNKKENEYVKITPIELKNILVVQEIPFKDEMTVEKAILAKFDELDKRPLKYLHFKVSEKEASKLLGNIEYIELERSIKANFKSAKMYINKGYYPILQIECEKENLPIIEKQVKTFLTKFRAGSKQNPDEDNENIEDDEEQQSFAIPSKAWHCQRCGDSGNVRRLHLCKHEFCTTCLQNHCYESLNSYTKGKITGLNQPLLFCIDQGCKKELSSADIFRFLPDCRLETIMAKIVNDLLSMKSFKHLQPCSKCGYLNKKSERQTCTRCTEKM